MLLAGWFTGNGGRGDAVVLGIAMNLLAVGLTSFLLRTVFGVQGTFDSPSLAGLPLVGGFTPLAYPAFVAVAVATLMLSRHEWGLRLRGVGEAPDAAATLGVSPARCKYAAVLVSGVLCGLVGAQLAPICCPRTPSIRPTPRLRRRPARARRSRTVRCRT